MCANEGPEMKKNHVCFLGWDEWEWGFQRSKEMFEFILLFDSEGGKLFQYPVLVH
jgi:hypothetical protein